MRLAVLALVLLVAAGCGTGPGGTTAADRGVPLKSLCPGVHVALDALVISDPASRAVFADQLQRLGTAASSTSRATLKPLFAAADELLAVKSDQDFYLARDDVHAAVVEVDSGCVEVGSPILHSGPHTTG